MNILFIEDERDLLETAFAQIERGKHRIFPATTIAEARTIFEDESKDVNIVITDHRLPDDLCIQFAIEIQRTYPSTKSAIISGCLTPDGIAELEAYELLYFRKPLLHTKMVDSIRKHYALRAHVVSPSEQQEEDKEQEKPREQEESHQAKADDSVGDDVLELPVPKRKLWGLFGRDLKVNKPSTDS